MKRSFFAKVIVVAVTISMLSSCKKDDSLSIHNDGTGSSSEPVTVYMTADRWQETGYHIFVDVISNVIPLQKANQSVNVYLVSGGEETLINQPVSFVGGGQVWATTSQTDVVVNYQGNLPAAPYLNLKVVIE